MDMILAKLYSTDIYSMIIALMNRNYMALLDKTKLLFLSLESNWVKFLMLWSTCEKECPFIYAGFQAKFN